MSAYQLPEDVLDAARALADSGEAGWRALARLTIGVLQSSNGVPRMVVYQQLAHATDLGVSTVRLYHQLETRYGELLDEIQVLRFSHLRLALSEARRSTGSRCSPLEVQAVILRRLKESDEFGGRLPPPDVWKAQLREGKQEGTPERFYESALRNLASYLRHSPPSTRGQPRSKIQAARAALDILENK